MKKIWGISFSLIGDLIMGLPQLNYYKNKYKDIYIYFVIHKKISYCAPLFFNHPLIDKIIISGEWSGFNSHDYEIAKNCEIISTDIDHQYKKILDRKHDDKFWYNKRNCIEENAYMSGITDLNKFLTDDQKMPRLYQWFDSGFDIPQKKAAYSYKKSDKSDLNYILSKSIAIWPFAGYGGSKNRNPLPDWWASLVNKFVSERINVYHLGYHKEPKLSDNLNYYHNLTQLSFFDQIKISLGAKFSLGTDSGSMWVLSAYSHPTLTLLTNWNENHNQNYEALLPINKNGDHIFCENNFNALDVNQIFEKSLSKGITSISKIGKFFNKF